MTRAVGLKGEVGIKGTEGILAKLPRIALRRAAGEPEERTILEARRQGRIWAVRLEGLEGRAAAEAWLGAEVLAERSEMGDAGPERHFWADLEGLPVWSRQGERLGRVTGLLETGGVDVLVVQGDRGELLVPLAPYVVVERERVLVDPPEGLFEPSPAERKGARRR